MYYNFFPTVFSFVAYLVHSTKTTFSKFILL